jgi:hypothetical protein
VRVVVKDGSGNVATNYSGTLAIALTSNPGHSTLGGVTTVSITPTSKTPGTATFTGLSLNKLGTGYTLTVTGSGLPATTTSPFNVKVSPTITSEKVVSTGPKTAPVVTGFSFHYSTTMGASASVHANYQMYVITLKTVTKIIHGKPTKVTVKVLKAVPFTLKLTGTTVTLTIRGKQPFTNGGQITVVGKSPSGVRDSSGLFLYGGRNKVFTISPKAKSIKPA